MQIASFQNLGHCLYPIRLEANEDFQSFDLKYRALDFSYQALGQGYEDALLKQAGGEQSRAAFHWQERSRSILVL